MELEACHSSPASWKRKSIDSVCAKFTSGGTPSRRCPWYYTNGTIPWVKTQELQDGLITQTEELITDEAVANSSAKVLPAGTILLAMYGATVGQLGVLSRPMTCNQACAAMVVDANQADRDFLYYLLLQHRSQIKSLATGAAQQNLSGLQIKQFILPFPEVSVQARIGSMLRTLDDKIELNGRINETLEAIARAIFKDWFVEFGPTRAKAEGRAAYLAPEVWALFPDRLDDDDKPKGWKDGWLGDVAENVGESVKPDEMSPDTPYIGLEHMPRRSIALNSWEGAGKVTSGKLAFHRGDFLFGKLRPYFHKVGIAPLDGICSTDILVLGPKTPAVAAFVLSCISTDEFVVYTDQTSGGTKMPRTSWEVMARYPLALPSEYVLQAFQHTVAPMLDRIVANIHEASSLAQTRDLLLPKLMSGEIRLRDAEKVLEQVA